MKRSTALGLSVAAVIAVILAAWLLRGPVARWSGQAGDASPRPAPLVQVQPVEARTIASRLSATGTLEAPEAVMLTTERAGRVAEIRFEEGRAVSEGDVLLELDASRERAAVEQAEARVAEARRALERARELRDGDFVSPSRLDELELAFASAEAALTVARADLQDMRILAPFDGVTGRRLVSPGALIEPGTAITRLVAVGALDVLFELPGVDAASARPGMDLQARTGAYPERSFAGTVRFVAPTVDPNTRTLAVEARINNADGDLRPGMFVEVALETAGRQVLTVPEGALLLRGPASFLFVLGEDDIVQRRAVDTGVRRDGWVEILGGLEAGERVIVSGVQKVRDGQPARTDPP